MVSGLSNPSSRENPKSLIKKSSVFNEEIDINDVVIERAHRVKAYSAEKKNSKKLRPREVVYKRLSFVDKARILKNNHHLKVSTHYVNEDFSKETLAYRQE